MITTTLLHTKTLHDRSQGTVSTVVIGLSVSFLTLVVGVVAISCLAPIIEQFSDIVLTLSHPG